MTTQDELLAAIDEELRATPKYYDFAVVERSMIGDLWAIRINPARTQVFPRRGRTPTLDEAFEDSKAWWKGTGGQPNGFADVLSVEPDHDRINLRFASSQPPDKGGTLRIYPPEYLVSLRQFWASPNQANASLQWLERAAQSPAFDPNTASKNAFFKWLRRNQTEAFELTGWSCGFLWGPPGTGKTTTVGALLATYLLQFPGNRVLLCSSTNSAVDMALLKVDESLEKIGGITRPVREKCFRLGYNFQAGLYDGRRHLLPIRRTDLITRLNQLEANKPEVKDVTEHARWKSEVENVKAEMREHSLKITNSARLLALTTARGIFTRADLAASPKFDLIVFDEASQVSVAHSLALAPLGKACLFAGDPKQLAPIARSKEPKTRLWMGESMFYFMKTKTKNAVMLHEQSRMMHEICRVVSALFYEGELQLASDKANCFLWQMERSLALSPSHLQERLVLVPVTQGAAWSPKYGGKIRHESATKVCDALIAELSPVHMLRMKPEDILVITPYRSQRSLIKAMIRAKRLANVPVRTVHGAQGTEQHTIIFDPVDGGDDFLRTEEAKRLFNVAFSRAAARLIVLLSPGDEANPILKQLADMIRYPDGQRP